MEENSAGTVVLSEEIGAVITLPSADIFEEDARGGLGGLLPPTKLLLRSFYADYFQVIERFHARLKAHEDELTDLPSAVRIIREIVEKLQNKRSLDVEETLVYAGLRGPPEMFSDSFRARAETACHLYDQGGTHTAPQKFGRLICDYWREMEKAQNPSSRPTRGARTGTGPKNFSRA